MGAYSKLHNETYRMLSSEFPEFILRENIKPVWLVDSNLSRLEIDIYIENIKTAVEIQGEQHYEFIPHFHKTYRDFEEQKRRDEEKRNLCFGNGVKLVEIACFMDLSAFIHELKRLHRYEDLVKHFESKMKSEKFRLWRKKRRYWKDHHRPEGWIPTPPPVGLPGSKGQKAYSLKLFSEPLGEATWRVYGGRNEHIVVQAIDHFTCDCQHFVDTGKNCSHILRIYRDQKTI